MLPHLNRIQIFGIWVIIALAGLATGYLGYKSAQTAYENGVVNSARRSAVAFGAVDLAELTGKPSDTNLPSFSGVKDRLIRLGAVNPDVRRIYLIRRASGPTGPKANATVYLADSVPTDSEGVVHPGDPYEADLRSPGVAPLLTANVPVLVGPFSSGKVSWLTAYAPVVSESGAPVVILGLDYTTPAFWTPGVNNGFARAFYVWVLLGVPFALMVLIKKQTEQREVLRNLTAAIEQSHSAVMITDLNSRVEYVNAGLTQQMGFGRRDLLGRNWKDFQQPETPKELLADLAATVQSGSSWSGEWFNRKKNGDLYPVRGVVTPVKHRDGTLSCYVTVFEDMTDLKANENRLRDALTRAEAGDRAKSQFLATISHEVRTPLNGIVGFTGLLSATPLNAEQREYVQTIGVSAEALIQLTGDILDFARIESGRLKLEMQDCDIRDSVEEALELMGARAAVKNIELLHWIDPAVPRLIKADTGRLRQVLVNLLNNAVKFTDSGEVEVTVDASTPGTGGPWPERTLTFTVRDTGVGIAPEHHDKLFRPFSQVDDSITRRHGGTGLGLAICKNLVHMMGGGISLASEPGKGSTFVFTIWARTEFAAPEITPQLSGIPIAVCTPSHGYRDELSRLCERYDGQAVPTGDLNRLEKLKWNVALIDLDHDGARAYLERPVPDPIVPAEKAIGLIPVSLPSDVRTELRKHFRALVNKPLRHDSFPGLVLGTEVVEAPVAEPSAGMALRILLVEDNVVNQKLMQRLLDQVGCPWVLAENGREALEELATPLMNFDLVLLDLHMPEVDGLTVLEKVRAGEAGKMAQGIWIIALTADARTEQRERAVAAGANDYLTKPLKPGTLSAALRRCVVERGRRQL